MFVEDRRAKLITASIKSRKRVKRNVRSKKKIMRGVWNEEKRELSNEHEAII